MTLELCTLVKGVPYGLASLQYTDHESSFKGIGIFNEGKLTKAPFTCIDGEGTVRSFSKMEDGRPADNSYCTRFNENGSTQHLESLRDRNEVSGW